MNFKDRESYCHTERRKQYSTKKQHTRKAEAI